MIEQVENFWNQQPCNIKHSSKEFLSLDYFNEVSLRRYTVEPHIQDFAQFKNYKNKSVLEIGFGIGSDAIEFVKAGANYTGIELSKESIKITKERFHKYNLRGTLVNGNCENFNLNRHFDLIYSFGVLHHTPNIENAIEMIHRHSSSNTTIKIMLYAQNSYKNIMILENLDRPENQKNCPIANTYTRKEIEKLFYKFKIVSCFKKHIFTYKIDQYKKGILEKEEYFKVMPNKIFNALEKHLGWHYLIELTL
jgi:ubiquinone/menaquinone biosynthesis C-methylase UbiE